MTTPYANAPDDLLISLLFTEGDRVSRDLIDEIIGRGPAMVDPLTWLVMDVEAWRAAPPAHWAPIHAVFALGGIGGEPALMGLLAAADHAEACGAEPVIAALPAIFARVGSVARPLLSERLRDHGRRPRFRALMAECLAVSTLRDPQGAEAAFAEIRAVSGESDADLQGAIERVLADVGSRLGEESESSYDCGWLTRYAPEGAEGPHSEKSLVGATEVELTDEGEPEPVAQVVRRQPKIGRNASCPCGSGKKYKKCCLEVDAVLEPLGI
jgi:hypothetical protein